MDPTAQSLFDYLRDILYEPDKAHLDLESLPEGFRELGKGLQYYAHALDELRTFARALGKGNLSAPLPPSSNELASPLKSLHASLKHLTWQSQQVAKGDYSQRVDFMGEFADAFNSMIELLDERQKALVAEIESGREKTLALEQANSLFEALTEKSSQSIVVMDRATGQQLFANHAAQAQLLAQGSCASDLQEWLMSQTALMAVTAAEREDELPLDDGGVTRFFHVASYPVNWRARKAVAYVVSDVSTERQMVQELEDAAYIDNLTHLYSRHFGMQVLRDWLKEGKTFSLCFVDMDNLKYVNDTFGHPEGDRYIISTGIQLEKFCTGCVASRLGGDEFMVLAENWDERTSVERMEELRDQLAAGSAKETPGYVRSISYGVVAVTGENSRSSSDLLSEADERMYSYKRAHKSQRQSPY